jgi:hypothetical protein
VSSWEGPLNRDTAVAHRREERVKLHPGEVCRCPASPYCGGAGSSDWATCSTACKPCRLPAPRPIEPPNPSSGEG